MNRILNGADIATRVADGLHEADIYQCGIPERFDVPNPQSLLPTGRNVLAVEVHNISTSSSDLTITPLVTLETSSPPAEYRGVAAEPGPIGVHTLPR